jgi:hypothetical protein
MKEKDYREKMNMKGLRKIRRRERMRKKWKGRK